MNVNNDIKEAMFLLKPNKSVKELEELYSTYFKTIYSFSTENLSGYYKYFNFINKKYLTVTGSGDQTLNAILKGCRNIDCFDMNKISKYYQELKIQAIKDLDYYEFLLFFCKKITNYKKNKYSFNEFLYNKIKLTGNNKLFWDSLYKESDNIRKTDLFNQDLYDLKVIIDSNDYLKEENYYILKKILLTNNININYYDMDIKELPTLNNSYDLVNLSNIASYLYLIFDKDLLLNFKKIIDGIKLNDNGVIILNYFYEKYNDLYSDDDIYSVNNVKKIFNNKIKYLTIDSINKEEHKILKKFIDYKDYVMLHKK